MSRKRLAAPRFAEHRLDPDGPDFDPFAAVEALEVLIVHPRCFAVPGEAVFTGRGGPPRCR